MRRLSTVAAMVILAAATVAQGKIVVYGGLDMAETSDVVLRGKVTEVGKESATVEVAEWVWGKMAVEKVKVVPVTTPTCFGLVVNFVVGEEVLVIGKSGKEGEVTVAGNGQGKRKLDDKTRAGDVATAKRLMEIAAIKEEDGKIKAMIGEARSKSVWMQDEVHRFVSTKVLSGRTAEGYRAELIDLLGDKEAGVQRIGLDGIRFLKLEGALPRVIELSKSEDLGVATSASMALAQYDEAASTKALIALTKDSRQAVRMRACLDLGMSGREAGKEAIAALLSDSDTLVRMMAPRSLIILLRKGAADDLVPKLVEMLNDKEESVRTSVVDALGETRSLKALEALVGMLKAGKATGFVERQMMNALYCHYSNGGKEAKGTVEKEMGLVIEELKRGKKDESFGPAFYAVGILELCPMTEAKEALKWAAAEHPNEEIRKCAERAIKK